MGIEEETDRTLFIRNLDARVTEELLFELFLQAGPLIKIKIPKDSDGKQKTFGFAVYKHEVSVPYAMQLLDGTSLHGRTLHVQFRSGSSHSSSPGNSQNSSPANTPNPHGQRIQFSSPPYTQAPQMQRSFSSPDNLQKNVMMNNMMWQLQMQQLQQLNGSFSKPPQRQPPAGGNSSGGGSRQHDNNPYRHQPSQMNSGGRNQRYADEPGSCRHQQHSHSRGSYHQNDRSGNRHHDSRGGNRHDDRGSSRCYQDNRWRRY
ncbi:RNA-binding protein 7 [Siniperca chuatsi]|uniref:RNA-binding protein 7 n=1 Tax=Siniperca chuatsi TaxID=119488 RepID=UPI001CE1FF8C|nr:RNA-binding protein 7 [Siniperca chuatsi]